MGLAAYLLRKDDCSDEEKVKYAAVLSALLLASAAAGLSCAGAEPVKSGPHPEVRLSAWSAYWDDASGAAEYRGIRRHLSSFPLLPPRMGPMMCSPCQRRRSAR